MPRLMFARTLGEQERKALETMVTGDNPRLATRANIILLSARDGYRVPEIAAEVSLGPDKVRKWLQRFNTAGVDGLMPKAYKPGPRPKFSPAVQAQIQRIARTPPRHLGLRRSQWTLFALKEYLVQNNIVNGISHETLRQILRHAEVDWRTRAHHDFMVRDMMH